MEPPVAQEGCAFPHIPEKSSGLLQTNSSKLQLSFFFLQSFGKEEFCFQSPPPPNPRQEPTFLFWELVGLEPSCQAYSTSSQQSFKSSCSQGMKGSTEVHRPIDKRCALLAAIS